MNMKDLTRRYLRLFKSSLRLRLKKLGIFFNKSWPFWAILLIVCTFFWKVFLLKQVPLPADFIVGVYYPWLDYKWGYTVGVPVKNPITTDVPSLIYPEQMLSVDLIKSGQWPLWNSYILTGTPLFANLQAASFSPTVVLYFLFGRLTAWSLQIILQHILAAFFSYLLLRYWKVSKFGSILGGVAFAFSGFNLIFSQWNGHTLASSFIPLAILFEDKYLKKSKIKDGALLALVLVFQLLSGYPQVCLYTAIAMLVFWLVRFCENRSLKFIKRTVSLVFFLILALGLASFQILPTTELWKLSQRSFEPHPFEWAFLPWNKVITFLAPDFYGNHATKNYWGPQDYTSNTGYVGVVVFILATLALKFLKTKRAVLFLFILSIFSLILSFPTPLSLFLWAKDVVGMRAASAHRATILFDFGMTLLAGFGFDYIWKARTKFKYAFTLILPSLIITGFGIFAAYKFLMTRSDPSLFLVREIPKYKVALRNMVLPTAILISTSATLYFIVRWKRFKKIGLLVLSFLLLFELFRFGWKFTPFSERRLVFPTTPVLDFLISQERPFRVTGNKVIPVNMRTPYKLDSLEGYETIHPLRVSRFLAALNSEKVGTRPVGRYGTVDNETSHLLDLVNTKYYLTHKLDKRRPSPSGEIPKKFKTPRFELVFEDKSVAILENKNALPRAFMVYDWEVIKDEQLILKKLLDSRYPFKEKIILEEEPEIKRKNNVAYKVSYREYKEQESIIDVQTDSEGLLFVSDAYYPGWKAYVDGIETKIFRANHMFRAIEIPKGNSQVKFVYKPDSFFTGLKISAAALSLWLILLVAEYKKKKK